MSLEEELVHVLMDKNLTLATAESCTGGLLGAHLTTVPGVSAVYAGGFITYTVEQKHAMLGVPMKLLREKGAVAKKTAKAMALGAAQRTGVDCSLSVTGNAGPDPSEGKPVGLVYIGCCVDGKAVGRKFMFKGSREEIREQSVQSALQILLHKLTGKEDKTIEEAD